MHVAILTQSALLSAILLIAMGFNTAFQEEKVAHKLPFLLFLMSFFLYSLMIFLYGIMPGNIFRRLLMLSGLLLGQSSLHFFQRYLNRAPNTLRSSLLAASVVGAVLVLTRLGENDLLAVLIALLGLSSYSYGIWSLWERRRSLEHSTESTRLLYVLVFGLLSILWLALDLLSMAGLALPALGSLSCTLYLYFWMQIVQRSRLLDLLEILVRGLVLLSHAGLMALVYVALVVWAGDQYGRFFFNTALASVVIIVTFEPVRRLINLWLWRLFFQESFELEVEMAGLRRELSNLINPEEVSERLLERLQASRRITHASVFLLESDGHGYRAEGAIGPLERRRLSVIQGRSLLKRLREAEIITREGLIQKLLDYPDDALLRELSELKEILEELSADLIFPFLSGPRLMGFLAVGDEQVREPFSSQEVALLSGVIRSVVTALENSEISERLAEKDRLSVIGEMATGMAHEIRNPLGAIKGAAQLLEPEGMDEEQSEFLEVILEETERLNLVLSQFLDYARPFRGTLEPLNLRRVLEGVAMLLRAEEWPGVKIDLELEDAPQVLGDGDLLRQVCLNLGRNGCEAMAEEGGRLKLQLRALGQRAEIRVEDNGPGISDEVRRNLFIPFFTTKRKGTGLGLAISQRIVAHHGSTIRVKSQMGAGSTMSFALSEISNRGTP